MRKRFVAGNWKMFTNQATARQLAAAVVKGVGTEQALHVARLSAVSVFAVGRRSAAREAGSRWVRRIAITRKKARSPARSAPPCSWMSAAVTSFSAIANDATNSAKRMRSSIAKSMPPWRRDWK